jgi:hypothetical protein
VSPKCKKLHDNILSTNKTCPIESLKSEIKIAACKLGQMILNSPFYREGSMCTIHMLSLKSVISKSDRIPVTDTGKGVGMRPN